MGKRKQMNINKIINQWKKHHYISQWRNKYTFIVPDRRSNELCIIKMKLSEKQAKEIITKLKLYKEKSSSFTHSSIWELNK